MKSISGIMSNQSKKEYLEACRVRYPSRNRAGKSAMIDEVSDALGWNRKHTIKALNGKVSLGRQSKKRGSKPIYGEIEQKIIISIWKITEQPCGKLLKPTLPLWLESYEKRHGEIRKEVREKVLRCSARQLDRITAPHKLGIDGKRGRRTGRTSHRIKTSVGVRCGPWEVDKPGWMEADTVSHGGGSCSGEYMNTLTLTDIHTGWTELSALWTQTGGEVRQGIQRIESRMPFELLGFDCDNGSEFLNETLEKYLLTRDRPIKWTRSRPYKKNDQAHVEQKNYTHVRLLLGYGRYDDINLKEMVNDLYENAWLPLRNYFIPAMKLIEKTRVGSKVLKKYDTPKTPCDRILNCSKVKDSIKKQLRESRAKFDPLELAELLESKLAPILKIVEETERYRAEQKAWAEAPLASAPAGAGSVPAPVAIAPCASTTPAPAETPCKTTRKEA
jgi:hypothetical protein